MIMPSARDSQALKTRCPKKASVSDMPKTVRGIHKTSHRIGLA